MHDVLGETANSVSVIDSRSLAYGCTSAGTGCRVADASQRPRRREPVAPTYGVPALDAAGSKRLVSVISSIPCAFSLAGLGWKERSGGVLARCGAAQSALTALAGTLFGAGAINLPSSPLSLAGLPQRPWGESSLACLDQLRTQS